jgi:hypothetical protein
VCGGVDGAKEEGAKGGEVEIAVLSARGTQGAQEEGTVVVECATRLEEREDEEAEQDLERDGSAVLGFIGAIDHGIAQLGESLMEA